MTSGVLATGIELQIYRYRFTNERKLILLKHILFSSILVNDSVIVIENGRKNFQLQVSTFEIFRLQLQQNRLINYNFVNYNYNFSKPELVGGWRRNSKIKRFLRCLIVIATW